MLVDVVRKGSKPGGKAGDPLGLVLHMHEYERCYFQHAEGTR